LAERILKDPVFEKSDYVVSFKNNVSSNGVAVLMVGWVPKEQRKVPAPRHITIAPGAEGEISGKVPAFANARRMVVVCSLDDGEAGRLKVLENSTPHSNERIDETTTWEMLVDAEEP
jgi:hypothetical protein